MTLLFDNGAFQTFDFFVDEGENGYLSIIAAILDVRMTTINKSKESDGWKEGAGGEIQLTDAIATQIANEKVYAYEFEGKRFEEFSGLMKLPKN